MEDSSPHCSAPIALFVYNRPDHTARTLAALGANSDAPNSDLYIFCDGPKVEEEGEATEAVRRLAHSATGFRSVHVIEREGNLGLAASIVDGVSRLVNEYGSVIVLEDDLLTAPGFLSFMNDGLRVYAQAPQVISISGYRYPVEKFEADDTFFLQIPLCWGWATWKDRWSNMTRDPALLRSLDRDQIRRLNFGDTYDFWSQAQRNIDGEIATWFIYWYAVSILNNQVTLFPSRSLVRNIGMDGTGVHCPPTDSFEVELSASQPEVIRKPPDASSNAYRAHQRYFRDINPSRMRRISNKLIHIFQGR